MGNDYITIEMDCGQNIDVMCCINEKQRTEYMNTLGVNCAKMHYDDPTEYGCAVAIIRDLKTKGLVCFFELIPKADDAAISQEFYDLVVQSVKDTVSSLRSITGMSVHAFINMCEDIFRFVYGKIVDQNEIYKQQMKKMRSWTPDFIMPEHKSLQ